MGPFAAVARQRSQARPNPEWVPSGEVMGAPVAWKFRPQLPPQLRRWAPILAQPLTFLQHAKLPSADLTEEEYAAVVQSFMHGVLPIRAGEVIMSVDLPDAVARYIAS